MKKIIILCILSAILNGKSIAQQSLGLDFGATRLLAPNIYLKSNIGFNVVLTYQYKFSKTGALMLTYDM